MLGPEKQHLEALRTELRVVMYLEGLLLLGKERPMRMYVTMANATSSLAR